MGRSVVHISRFLSLVLRHKPGEIGLVLDEKGWVSVKELIEKVSHHSMELDMEMLEFIVETNSKKRFAFNQDKTKIRASQGHSIDIDLGLQPVQPPEILYHGTAKANLDSIRASGIMKRSRQYVHLSGEMETAVKVGQRHGIPHILKIRSLEMYNDDFSFYLSDNNVWLTGEVPVKYILF